jgi:hypothetical protein
MPNRYAHRRALPWRYLLQLVGTVAAIGGGIVAVSTPATGAVCFAIGLLALLAGATD